MSIAFLNRFRRRQNQPSSSKDDSDRTKVDEDEDNKHQWDRPLEFVLSLISNSVGLGNVWRFPYLAAQNGGGAFLIPYFTLYFLIGAPLYYLELALGQFTSRGPGTGFVLARGWQGVGYAMIINSVLSTLYYNVLIAWALFYFILSFRKTLLWGDCTRSWNTDRCFVPGSESDTLTINGVRWNCTETQYANATYYGCTELNNAGKVTATEEFFYRLLLNKSESFDDFGVPGLYMSLLLLGAWLIICLCIIRGVQSSGKVAYFTAIFPYIVLLVLIIFTATLKGAGDGIRFYIVPRWKLIGNFKIWQAAASQVFFSLSLSSGSLIAYSAANKFNNGFFKQMCIVVLCDCFTGVFAGFAVFATIGFLAKSLNEPIEKYAQSSGPSLAFITYPEALSKMPASPFFSIIFFLMLLALGLGSQFAATDVPVTALMEIFPAYANRRYIIVIFTCITFYVFSLPFACPGGIYLFDLFQEYTANISLVFIGFFEVFTVAYIYGFNRFMNDVRMMLGKRAAEYYLLVTWCITAPLLTLILTITNLIDSAPLRYEPSAGFAEYDFPRWSTILGWLIFICCILPVPLVFVIRYIQQYRRIIAQNRTNRSNTNGIDYNTNDTNWKPPYLQALTLNNLPAETWGPRRKIHHYGAYAHLSARTNDNSKDAPNYHSRYDDQSTTMKNVSTHKGAINSVFDKNDVENAVQIPALNYRF